MMAQVYPCAALTGIPVLRNPTVALKKIIWPSVLRSFISVTIQEMLSTTPSVSTFLKLACSLPYPYSTTVSF
ncbi:hypothetical protein E2C01_102290 [Portunus trituberculatus]|uniref:Uncharacterized protein n=1 Tax=Portunus trituberculatus TaxID=210409 RepID=A0A5B7KI25_PORTR|nr:hypothetical protein [Portunus trituberculatus]